MASSTALKMELSANVNLGFILVVGQTYLTQGGQMAVIKMANPYVADVFNADGTYCTRAYYSATGESKGTNRALDIVGRLCDSTVNAVDWLVAHSQTILGVTASGVCVHDIGGEGYNVWLPARRQALRDFMNY